MIRTLSDNKVSIEQFAAFLDGNLSEEDMQNISAAIDANPEFTTILSDVMSVNDSLDFLSEHENILPDELQNMDFEIPEILSPSLTDTTVDLYMADAEDESSPQLLSTDVSNSDIEDTINENTPDLPTCMNVDNSDDIEITDFHVQEDSDFQELT